MFTLAVAVALSAGLLVNWVAVRAGIDNASIHASADGCITDLRAAHAAFKAAATTSPDPGRQPLALDDPHVVSVVRCQEALEALGVRQSGTSAAVVRDEDEDSSPVIANARIGAAQNRPNNCAFENAFRTGVIGASYNQRFGAKNPLGADAQGSVTMTNPAGPYCGVDSPAWSGSCFVSEENSRTATAGVSTVTLTASRAFTTALSQITDDCPQGLIRGSFKNGQFEASDTGTQCILVPTASVNNDCTKSGAVPDYVKGAITFDPTVGYCVLRCSGATSFAWNKRPVKIEDFTVSPLEIQKGDANQRPFLFAVVSHARSVTISGEGVSNPSPLVDPDKANVPVGPIYLNPRPDRTTRWTITAVGVDGDSESKAATLTVKEGAPTVAITAPAENAQISDFTVTVSGVVSPVPDPEHRKAQLLVNGGLLNVVDIDAAGNFSGAVPMMNTIPLSDIIVLGDTAVGVTKCGPVAASISVWAPVAKANNGIQVRVPLGNNNAASASRTVEHVVLVNSFAYDWNGTCGAAPGKNVSVGAILRAGQPSVLLGTVDCGVTGPTHCTDIANVTVATSVGQKRVPQTWTINVDQCN